MDNPSIKLPDNELAQPEAPVTLPDLEAPAAAPKVAPGAIPDTVPEPRPTAATEDEPTPAAVPPDTGALPDTAYRDYSTPLSQRHPTESQVATPLAEPTPDFDPDNSTATFNPGYSSVTDRDDYVQSALNRGIQPYQMPDKDLSREMFRAQNPDLTWGSLAMGGVKFTGGFVGKVFNPVEYWNSAKSLWPLFNGAGGAVYNSMIYEINKLPDIPAIGWEPSADKERTETSRNKLQGTWLTLKQNLQTQLDNLQISNSHLAGLVYRTVLRKADEHDFTNDQYDYFIKHQKVTEDVNQALAAGDIQKAIKVGYGGEGIGGQVMTAWGPVTVGPEPGSKESEQDAKKYATQQQLKAMGYSPKEVSEMGEAMTLGAELPLFELVPAGVAALPARGVVAAIPKVVRTGGKAMQAAGWMADHAARKAGWVSNLGMATGLWHGNPALMVKSLIGSTVVKPMLEQLAAKLDSLGKHVEYAGTRVGMGPSEEYVLRRLETEAGTAPTLGNMFLQSSIKTIQKIGASGAVLTAKGIPLYLSAPSPYEAGQQAGGLFDLGALTKSTGLGVRATFIDGIAKTPGGPKAPLSSKSFNYGVDPELDTAHNSETESWAQENRDNLNRSRHALQGSAEVYAMPSDLFEATYGERAGVYLRGEGGKPATIIYNGERGYEAAKAHEPSHVIWDKILTPQQKEEIIPTLFKLNNPSQFASNYYSLSTGNPVRVDFDSLPQSVSDPADPLHATKDVVLSEMFADALRHYSIDQITVNPGIMRSMQYGIGKVMESMGFPVSPAESTGFLGLQPSATALFTLENSMRQIAADQVSVGTNYGKPLPPDPGIHFKDVRDALRALGYSATDASTMASNAIGDARALGSRIDVTPEVLTKRALTGKFPPDAIWQQGKAPTNAWEAEANKLVTEFKDQGIPEEQAVIQAADVMQDREKLRRPAGQGIERKIPQQQQYMLDVAPEAEGFKPDFYSRAALTLQANPQGKWDADQLRGFLKGKGISENEMEWSGINDLQGKLTKQEALDAIKLPQVIETQLSDSKSISVNNIARDQYGVDYNDLDPPEQRAVMDNFNSSAEGTHYSNPNLNLPGGTNYRELLFQLEHPEPKSGLNPKNTNGSRTC